MKGSNKSNRTKLNGHLHKIFANITKFSRWIEKNLNFHSIAKNTLIFICSFIFTCFIYSLLRTKSPISDIFTTDRISILKDRPTNITRDIIVDLSSFYEVGGIMNLASALIEGIAVKRPNWRLLVLISKENKHMYNLPKMNNLKPIEIDFSYSPIVLFEKLNPKSFCLIHDKLVQLFYYDLFFIDSNCDLIWDPAGDSNLCNFLTVPRISIIHDLASFDTTPEFYRSEIDRWAAKLCLKDSIRFSKKIVTVSKFSQNRICDKFNVSKDFVKYIPIKLGTRVYSKATPKKHADILNKYKLAPQKYFIFCSSWWKNKNHGNLMKAFRKFAKTNSDVKLILVGKHPDVFKSRPIKDYCSDRLIITGFVPDEELGILLKNALAFIHPSVYEGFGMPIIEAMANGIPVACSNVASLPEIADSAALLFNPFNIDSITQAMHRLADDPELRKELIEKGYEQAKKYSDRDAMVDEYIRVMEEVMEENDKQKSIPVSLPRLLT